MPMTLYAHPDQCATKKMLLAACYSGLDVEIPKKLSKDEVGRIPVLETDKGCIFSSGAIARYLSRLRRDVSLYGQNLLEAAMVDSWTEFSVNELEVPLNFWIDQVRQGSTMNVPEEVLARAKADTEKALAVLNKHLLVFTYMVGDHITLADISLCCALADGFKHVLSPEIRSSLGNLDRWFNLCMAQPEFQQVLGKASFCDGSRKASEAKPAKEEKKAEAKKEPKKEKGGAAPKAKAEEKPAKEDKKAEAKKETKKEKGGAAPKAKAQEKPEAPVVDAAAAEAEAKKKKEKKVIKEGGKRGVEIDGAADMGGLQFFCTSVDEPEGNMELLVMCMDAMNAESDPTEEERKGGSGRIGKMIFSACTEHLAVLAYVPEALKDSIDAKEWLKKVLDTFGGEAPEGSSVLAKGIVKADGDKGKFPLKMKEPCITEAIAYLKGKGLFPDKDDDSDDDYVFGDDDFPS